MSAKYNIIEEETGFIRAWGLSRKEAENVLAEFRRSYPALTGKMVPMPKTPAKDDFHEEESGPFQMLGTAVLAAAAQGHIDLNEWAKDELINRGLDAHGKWVGFEEAKRLHAIKTYPAYNRAGKKIKVTIPED